MTLKILIAADHGGFDLKEEIKNFVFTDLNIEWIDLGTYSNESVDYPDYGFKLSQAMDDGQADTGVVICGSGIGISIAVNRNPKMRAALCTSTKMAKLSREHNDANVLALGARVTDRDTAIQIVETFLTTNFEGGRHARRVEKLSGGCSHA